MKLKAYDEAYPSPSGIVGARRRFWAQVYKAVKSAQPIQGEHITLDEHDDGVVVNADDRGGANTSIPGGGGTGACCQGSVCTETDAASCDAAGGVFHSGVPCTDGYCMSFLPGCQGCTSYWIKDGRVYRTYEEQLFRTWHNTVGPITNYPNPGVTCAKTQEIEDDFTEVQTYFPPDCSVEAICVGSGFQRQDYIANNPPGCTTHAPVYITDAYCDRSIWPGGLSGLYFDITTSPGHIPCSSSNSSGINYYYYQCSFTYGSGYVSLFQGFFDECNPDA